MPQKVIFKFMVTTRPLVANVASAHSGSWSESHWAGNVVTPDDESVRNIARYRADLLPKEATLIGVTVANYTISKNKLIPGATRSGKFHFPGLSAYTVNVPQDALALRLPITGRINSVRTVLGCAPDEIMESGEYNGNPLFQRAVSLFMTRLRIEAAAFGSIVTDLSLPQARILSIAANVITTDLAGVAVVGDYVKLKRVTTVTGSIVTGTYLVTAVAGAVYTVQGLNVTVNLKGSMRKDVVVFGTYDFGTVDRACTRKIGSPFERYRGRRSKQLA